MKDTATLPTALLAAWLLVGCEAPDTVLAKHGCSSCHTPSTEGLGPSLRLISTHYSSREELVQFLEGKSAPRVSPEGFEAMKPMVEKTRALTPEERTRIAEAILRHRAG
ncbi:c-type cytochrome [Archangium violaceum]|uniref:c-type cytochrome n=1 Tax=Archangium violaceum TaxID=83451 RepID=UPI0019512FED|nr:c-type cytochrome [Archangium violaceum]QRN99574.1 c-type cytochrome [Archangium violaceum]